MATAKDIIVKPITAAAANKVVKAVHYSGKVVQNSNLHFGVFLNGRLEGAMSFGSPLDKRKVLPLVKDTAWNNMLELNRMAFSDVLPRNSESRAMAIAFRLIKKHYPHIEWVLSFSDGTQCGDGTIYRAAGFVLTGIKENNTLYLMPNGDTLAGMTIEANYYLPQVRAVSDYLGIDHKQRTRSEWRNLGAKPLKGHQLRYIYFLNPAAKQRLTVPILPFSEIDKAGARMYKGIAYKAGDSGDQSCSGGAEPTCTLQSNEGIAL